QRVMAHIENMGKGRTPKLSISGNLMGDLAHGMQFLREFPGKNNPDVIINHLSLHGPMQLHLNLFMPLRHIKGDVKASGQVSTHDGQLSLSHWPINLEQIRGNMAFTGTNLSARDLQATYLKQPIKFKLTTMHDAQQLITKINATGRFDSAIMQRQ